MISSKLNFLVSAAILASTVYILWIKIKRKSNSHHKIESDSEICKKSHSEEVFELQSESLNDYDDSKFNTKEGNESHGLINDESELQSILETKCSFNIGELGAQNLNDQEKIYPLTNIVNISGEEIRNNNLEISAITKEINNTGHELMEEKKYNYNEFSTEVENENEINMSLEDGEIIDESLVENQLLSVISDKFENIINGNINNNLSEKDSKQAPEISNYERQIPIKSLDVFEEIEEGEIVENGIEDSKNEKDEEKYEKTFEELLDEMLVKEPIYTIDNVHFISNMSEEFYKSLEDGEIIVESFAENGIEDSNSEKDEENQNFSGESLEDGEIIDESFVENVILNFIGEEKCEKTFEELLDEMLVKEPIYTIDNVHFISNMSEEFYKSLEDGEIIVESFAENGIEDSISDIDEENQERIDEIEMFPKNSVENLDIINTVDKEIEVLMGINISNEVVNSIENIDSIDITGEKTEELIDNKEEIIEESIPIQNSIDSVDNTDEKTEELIDNKEEIIEESMPIENYKQDKEESDRFCSTETGIEKEKLITSIINDANTEEISNNNNLIDEIKDEYLGNDVEYSKIENTESSTNNINLSTSDLSQNSDYLDDAPLDKFMDYIDECLNGNESKIDENCKLENWPNDEDSLNNIKRDFYENSTAICSPHPSSESDHAHCVNNLTERVAILSAESILDNQCQLMNSSDSEMTPTLSSPTLDDSNPELYVEKITYDGKELDVVYFEESLLEEGGIQSDIKIIRTIPVGLGGRIIGKKGKTKNELLKKYGAQLLIYNHPNEIGKQILEITCNPSVSSQLENWVNKTLEQISKNTIQTTVSNPEWLKPMIPLGRLVAAHIVDMSTVQYVKIRIFDQKLIKEFNQMQNEMNIDYSRADNTSLLPRPVAAGCVCVAMIRPDYFLRAQIVDIYEDFAWVYLFDLGKVCQTYLCYLFKIREKYMRVPFQVIPARMPHALIKNKNISPAIIYKRFLCDPVTNKPKMVRVFFPRMNTCCEPCVNIYIPMSTVSADSSSNNGEFVDLLELLVSIDVCSMVRETVNSDMQVKINTNHFRAFLNGKDKKQNSANSNVPVYFQPCNSKFYDDFIEFKSENETTN